MPIKIDYDPVEEHSTGALRPDLGDKAKCLDYKALKNTVAYAARLNIAASVPEEHRDKKGLCVYSMITVHDFISDANGTTCLLRVDVHELWPVNSTGTTVHEDVQLVAMYKINDSVSCDINRLWGCKVHGWHWAEAYLAAASLDGVPFGEGDFKPKKEGKPYIFIARVQRHQKDNNRKYYRYKNQEESAETIEEVESFVDRAQIDLLEGPVYDEFDAVPEHCHDTASIHIADDDVGAAVAGMFNVERDAAVIQVDYTQPLAEDMTVSTEEAVSSTEEAVRSEEPADL